MTKRLTTAACLAVVMVVGIAPADTLGQAEKIRWGEDPKAAMTRAQSTGQPILAYATSDNCGYCRKMERDAWSNPKIVHQVASGFVPLRLHARRDAKLIAKLRVRAYPTTVLVSPEGRVIAGAQGYLPAERLEGLLSSIRTAEKADATGVAAR